MVMDDTENDDDNAGDGGHDNEDNDNDRDGDSKDGGSYEKIYSTLRVKRVKWPWMAGWEVWER